MISPNLRNKSLPQIMGETFYRYNNIDRVLTGIKPVLEEGVVPLY